jgi:hypothetical protein
MPLVLSGNAGTISDLRLMIVDNTLRIKGVQRECQGSSVTAEFIRRLITHFFDQWVRDCAFQFR